MRSNAMLSGQPHHLSVLHQGARLSHVKTTQPLLCPLHDIQVIALVLWDKVGLLCKIQLDYCC